MSRMRSNPVDRSRVALGALLTVLIISGIVGMAEWLRPHAGDPDRVVVNESLAADPRLALNCPEPQAREGRRPRGAPRLPTAVTSGELLDCPTTWDGRTVRYSGELIGAVLQRREGAWLQVNDDEYAHGLGPLPSHPNLRGGNAGIGVWIPRTLIDRIQTLGGPRQQGDVVELTGVYHRVDPHSREVAIIRATDLRVLISGGPATAPVAPRRVVTAIVLGSIAAGFLIAQWRQRRRFRR